MRIIKAPNFLMLALCLFLYSCDDEVIETDLSVYTEEIVFTSAESVIMTGRVLAFGQIALEDHGFQISTDENFTNPIVVSLGGKEIPGRFVGQSNGLNSRTTYFCRSFITYGGETKTGNTLSLATFSPKVIDFSPKEGISNVVITVEGLNLTADTEILWEGTTIVPEAIIAETFVEFRVPALQTNPVIFFKVVSKGDTLTLNQPYEHIIGQWTNLGPLDDMERNQRHIYFEDGDDFIYGLGLALQFLTNNVHVLDKNTLQRTVLNFPGVAVEGAFFDNTYFGGGSTEKVFSPVQQLNISKEFWKYENQSFIRLADCPARLYKAVALAADGKVYLYGGETMLRQRNLLYYVYDIATDEWSTGSYAPVSPLNSYPSFHLNGYNYFVVEDGTTYRHDYANNVWETVAKFPVKPQEYGYSIVLDGKAFVGLQGLEKRSYVYRPDDNVWRTKRSIAESTFFETKGVWTNNGLIYVVRNNQTSITERFLWRFDPNGF